MDKYTIELEDGTKKEVSQEEYMVHILLKPLEKQVEVLVSEAEGDLGKKFEDALAEVKTQLETQIKEVGAQIKLVNPTGTKPDEHRPEIKYLGGGILEAYDGSQYDTKRRKWVHAGPDATQWAKDLQQVFRCKVEKRSLPGEVETRLHEVATKYLSEEIGPAGGYLVPPAFSTSIISVDADMAQLWPAATEWPMNSVELSFPRLKQTLKGADETGVDYFAGVIGSWLESGTTKTESEPEFEQLTLHPREYALYTELQNSLLQSSPVNLLNYLSNLFQRAYSWNVDLAFFRGTGTGQPLGIITDPQVPTVTRQTANRVRYRDLLNMQTRLPGPFRAGAVWFCSLDVLNDLRDERDTNNRPIVQVIDRSELGRGPYNALLGHRVVLTDFKTQTIGTTGDIILGNPAYYYVGSRGTFMVDVSTHFKFQSNKTAIRGSGMVDGQPSISKAFVMLEDTVTS